MSTIEFNYTPLDPKLREIRVLTLLPGNFDEPIQANVTTQSLKASPTYNALSYVWGDPASARDPGNTLAIQGHGFPITANLRAALQHLRPPAGADPVTLWVDAICINQADLDERTLQVSMMRDIYASAERVIIWLGEADEESNVVFDALPFLAAQDPRRGDVKQDETLRDTMSLCSGFFSGLAERRSWFSRVWIIQELAMAKQDPLVVCGRKSASWSTLMKAWELIARAQFTEIGMVRRKGQSGNERIQGGNSIEKVDDPPEDEDDIEVLGKLKIDVLDELYKAIQSQGGESLRKLLIISRTSGATDPRDRIYALLGLLKPDTIDSKSEGSIVVDYRKPTSEVYADAVAHIFAQGEGPNFLSTVFLPGISAAAPHIPSLPAATPQPNLPSWVPDFSKQVAGGDTQPSSTSFWPPAGAGASGVGADCNNGKRLKRSIIIQVEGLFVDTIEEVVFLGSTFDSYIDRLPSLESLASIAKERSCQLESSIAPHMERFKSKEPLWRALISNKRFLSGYDPAPSSYEEMYLSLLSQLVESTDAKSEAQHGPRSEYEQCLWSKVGKQSFFTTKSGFVGTCVPDSQEGDVVAVLFGSPVPFVLRPKAQSVEVDGVERLTHLLVGASYVSGIMNGEMVDELYCEDLMDSTTFFLQ